MHFLSISELARRIGEWAGQLRPPSASPVHVLNLRSRMGTWQLPTSIVDVWAPGDFTTEY